MWSKIRHISKFSRRERIQLYFRLRKPRAPSPAFGVTHVIGNRNSAGARLCNFSLQCTFYITANSLAVSERGFKRQEQVRKRLRTTDDTAFHVLGWNCQFIFRKSCRIISLVDVRNHLVRTGAAERSTLVRSPRTFHKKGTYALWCMNKNRLFCANVLRIFPVLNGLVAAYA